jgi:hypothetical protein
MDKWEIKLKSFFIHTQKNGLSIEENTHRVGENI